MDEKEKNIQPEKQLDEKRKAALLRYLGVMFLVAFVFVLLSLIGTLRSNKEAILELNQSSTSALTKVEQLQNDNRQLETDNAYLEGRIEELEKQLEEAELELDESRDALSRQTHTVEHLTQQLTQSRQETQELVTAYEDLLEAQQLAEAGSDVSEVLIGLKEKVKYFAETALNIYENLTNKGEE